MFGTRLKQLRESRGFTQEELAALVGVATQQIWRWESGKNDPTGEMIIRLSKYLRASPTYLLGQTDDPNAELTEDKLSPMQRKLLAAISNGSVVEAMEILTTLFKERDQADIASHKKAVKG